MKKIILVCICAVFIIGGVVGLASHIIGFYLQKTDFNDDELSNINFELYGSYKIDTSGIIKWCALDLEEDTQFTFFFQVKDFENLQGETAEAFGFELSDHNFYSDDYQNNYIALTVGRELKKLQYEYREGHNQAFAEITFAEEYHDKIMYIYVMDKILLFPSDLSGVYNSFYIMNGEESVYYGDNILRLNNRLDQ